MGASESKTSIARHEFSFNEEDKKIVSNVFSSISHGKKSFNKENLQHFTSPVLDQVTSNRLFDILEGPLPHKQPHKGSNTRVQNQEIQLNHFTSYLAVILKGDVADLGRICFFLASPTSKTVSANDFIKFVTSILHSYEKLLSSHCAAYQSWIFADAEDSHVQLAHSLLSNLLQLEMTSPEELIISEEQIIDWLSQCSIFNQILQQVFRWAFHFSQTEPQQTTFQPQLPHVRNTNWSKFRTILDFPSVLFLNFSLLSELQSEWKLVFSSNLHGCSFSQLLQCMRNKGPTYLIIRDKDGHLFGGFAAVSWDIHSKFVGNASCFLFSAKPKYCIYKPTGYNNNFMYLNHQVQTLPNGLGMGGQFEFFGLWIDQSFDHGHSKASARGCTTYGSPQLSAKEEFEVDCIEVWTVGKKMKEGDEDEEEDTASGDLKRSFSNSHWISVVAGQWPYCISSRI